MNIKVHKDYSDELVQKVFVNNIDFTKNLRDNAVSINTAYVAQCKYIRNKIDKCQKDFGEKNNIVIDGRDTGSYVFPNANFKFYLDCSIAERARRRFNEEKLKNPKITIKEIENQLAIRDEMDRTRKIAPLVIPNNAIIIDSTNLNLEKVVQEVLKHISI